MPRPDLRAEERAYEKFTWGRRAAKRLQCVGPAGMPESVFELGLLKDITLESGEVVSLTGGSPVRLVADDAGRGLYLVSVSGVRASRGVPTGRILSIAYQAQKGTDAGRVIYEHEFEGRRPRFDIDADGRPVIRRDGSRFRVEWRGIVG